MIWRRLLFVGLVGMVMGTPLELPAVEVFKVNLVAVNGAIQIGETPFSLALKKGFVAVSDKGEVKVLIEGSNLTSGTELTLLFWPFDQAATPKELGKVTIGDHGNAEATVAPWTEPLTLVGIFSLNSGEKTCYLTGFSITPEAPEPPEPPGPPEENQEIVEKLNEIIDAVEELDPTAFKNANHKNTFLNKLDAILNQVEQGAPGASRKLLNDLLAKTDGCSIGGKPDKNDWIIDCDAQSQIYSLILEAVVLQEGP